LFQNLGESLAYIKNDPLARTLMMMGFVPTFLILPVFAALMPIFAKDILQSGAEGLGLLLSAIGLGALVGALFAGALGNFQRRGLMQLGALATMCLSVIAFALVHNLYVALALLAIAGFCEEVFLVTNQALLQLSVPDELRGRVTSFFLLNTGLQPLGAFFAGVLADALGAAVTTILMAALAGALGIAIAIAVPRVRDLRLSEILQEAEGTPSAR
jgi:MFS family permease